MSIIIYPSEARAGLTDLIQQNFVTACSQIHKDVKEINPKILEGLSTASDLSLPDLFPVQGILASSLDNLNDDFFEPKETFAARHTPLNKPFDFEHKASDIIGHMTSAWVSDHEGNVIDSEDKLPDAFDIPYTAVLYRHFTDNKVKQARADKIFAALENPTDEDKWFCSMECRFRGFDYLMFEEGDSIANAKLVKRTEDTAFLTKHLRIYGGQGSFKGNRVLRVFRNLTFSGIGLVRQPGNPRSVISTASARINSGKIYTFKPVLGYDKINEDIMNENEFKELKDKLAKAEARVSELVIEASKADYTKKVADLEGVVVSLKKELESSVASVAAKNGEVEVAKAALSKLETEKLNLVIELDKFKAETVKAEAARIKLERLGKVKEAYGVTDEAQADKIVVTFAALTDEAFASHCETIKGLVKPQVQKVVDVAEAAKVAVATATPVVEVNLTIPAGNKDEDNAKALAAEMLAWRGDVKDDDEGSSAAKGKKSKNKK